jgi:hypothetical protein
MVQEAETGHGGTRLVRSFGVLQLTMISVGATLGTGILVILGESVPLAGPAIWISFAIAGLAALLSAVSYAEMAGLVPAAGSSYSYTYATMGEGMAWICGWCLVLEYAVSVAAVAVGAGQYVNEALAVFGQALPDAVSQPPGDGGLVNVPAMLIVVLAMVLLVRGAKESAWINTAIVVVKVGILIFFCAVAFTAFNGGHFEPLLPMGPPAFPLPPPGSFLLHRLRRRLHGRRGSPQPEARPAEGHHAVHADRHHHLRPGGRRRRRRPAVGLVRRHRSRAGEDPRGDHRAAVDRAGVRRRSRAGHCQHRADCALRADPHPPVHVPRRPGSPHLWPRLAPHRDARLPGP